MSVEGQTEMAARQHPELQNAPGEDEVRLREAQMAPPEIKAMMKTAKEVKILEEKLQYKQKATIRSMEAGLDR